MIPVTYKITARRVWRAWAKQVEDVDLTKKGGYALLGPFLKIIVDKEDTLGFYEEGVLIVFAVQSGSRRYHSYRYLLIRVKEKASIENDMFQVQNAEEVTTPRSDVLCRQNPDLQQYFQKMKESKLFKYAVVISTLTRPTKTTSVASKLEALKGILSDEEIERLRREIGGHND